MRLMKATPYSAHGIHGGLHELNDSLKHLKDPVVDIHCRENGMSNTSPLSTCTMTSTPTTATTNEETLRDELRSVTQRLKRREPLDPTYRRLLLRGVVATVNPVLPKDQLYYKRVPSNLRGVVENFLQQTIGKNPFDRISQRQPIDDEQMRIAFNLREEKEHEQKGLLEATLAQFPRRCGMDVATRRKHMNGVALGLQMDPRQQQQKRQQQQQSNNHGKGSNTPTTLAAQQTENARQQAERERQAAQAKARETARIKRAEEERTKELAHQKKAHHAQETPEQAQNRALHKLYFPIFSKVSTR